MMVGLEGCVRGGVVCLRVLRVNVVGFLGKGVFG